MAGSEHSGTSPNEGAIPRRHILALLGGAAGGGLLAACGAGTAPTQTPRPTASVATPSPAATASAAPVSAPQTAGATTTGQALVIEAVEYAFKTMGSIPGGPTAVQLRNRGAEPHHAQFMRLNPGVAPEQVRDALRQGPAAAFPLVGFAGGPGIVRPGGTSEVVLDLQAGQYLLACFFPGPDHVAHAAKGMLLPLSVTAASPATAMPATAGTITLRDFEFDLPEAFPTGRRLYRVVNAGPQAHELQLLRPAPGKGVADVLAYYGRFADPLMDPAAGPLPAELIGGMQALGAGGSGTLVLDLPPGEYVATCDVHDQTRPDGALHAHLGMIRGFRVTAA